MKTCLVVGAGPGVSEAIARRFGSGGYAIGLIARTADALRQQCERLAAKGITAAYAVADAGKLDQLDAALDDLIARLGSCDVLIYNASVMLPGNPFDLSVERLMDEFKVNVLGAHRAAQRVAPAMVRASAGALLFTGGGLAFEPFPRWTSLAMGKAALRSFAISLFKELSPKGVHVSVLTICGIVQPGGPFDPDVIAEEYWRVATAARGVIDREVIFQSKGSDVFYNDPAQAHLETSLPPRYPY